MFSKSLFLAAGLLSASAAFSLPSKPVPGDPAIIPLPSALDVEKNKPGFLVSNTLPVSKTGDKSCIASFVTGFSNNLRQIMVSPAPSAANAVQIILKKDASLSPEWYSIKVSTQGITVSCTSPAGAFYAAQTLKQSLEKDAAGHWALPCMTITDSPRFTWRGIMIDSGRNPRSIAELGWTQPGRKDFTDFKERLDRHKPFLDAQRVNYRTDSGEPAQPEAKMIRE